MGPLKLAPVLVVLLFVSTTSAYRVCSKKGKLASRRKDLALAVKNESHLWVIGGTSSEDDDSGLVSTLQSFDMSNQEFNDESMSLPHSDFIQNSVQRISEKEYLLMPAETMAEFWVWDESAMSTATHVSFPQIGLSDYCLMHSATHHTAILTGGLIDGEETPSSDWFTLDTSNTSDLVWRQSDSALPFLRYGHSCCMISGIPVVYGGYDSTKNEHPTKSTYQYNFDNEQWEDLSSQTGKQSIFRSAFGVCVTEYQSIFNQSDLVDRGYVIGGRLNRSAANTAVLKLRFSDDEIKDELKVSKGNKLKGVNFRTGASHIRPGLLNLNGSAWLIGGSTNKDKVSQRWELLELSCGPRFNRLRNPLNRWFGLPWFVLFPLGLLSSFIFSNEFEKKEILREHIDDYDSLKHDNGGPKLPNTSVNIEPFPFPRSVELRVLSNEAQFNQQCAILEIRRLCNDTLNEILIEKLHFPEQVAHLVNDFMGQLEIKDVIYGRDYRERCTMKCCTLRIIAYLSYYYQCILDWLCCSYQCHSLRLSFKILLNISCFIILMYEYVRYVVLEYESVWQQASAIWLICFSHPSLTLGMDILIFRVKDTDIGMVNSLIELLVNGFILCTSVTASIPGFAAFFPFVLFCAILGAGLPLFGTELSWKRLKKRLMNVVNNHTVIRCWMWFWIITAARVCFVAFAVLTQGQGWWSSFVYGFLGQDCDSWKIDWDYPPTYFFILGWLL